MHQQDRKHAKKRGRKGSGAADGDRQPASPGGGAPEHSSSKTAAERRESEESGRAWMAARVREGVKASSNPNGCSGFVLCTSCERTVMRGPLDGQPKCKPGCISWLRPIPPFPTMQLWRPLCTTQARLTGLCKDPNSSGLHCASLAGP